MHLIIRNEQPGGKSIRKSRRLENNEWVLMSRTRVCVCDCRLCALCFKHGLCLVIEGSDTSACQRRANPVRHDWHSHNDLFLSWTGPRDTSLALLLSFLLSLFSSGVSEEATDGETERTRAWTSLLLEVCCWERARGGTVPLLRVTPGPRWQWGSVPK